MLARIGQPKQDQRKVPALGTVHPQAFPRDRLVELGDREQAPDRALGGFGKTKMPRLIRRFTATHYEQPFQAIFRRRAASRWSCVGARRRAGGTGPLLLSAEP